MNDRLFPADTDPLHALLRQAIATADDAAVRQWLQALLDGDSASSATTATGRAGEKCTAEIHK